jgi:putative transcriptional regulator
MTIKSRLSEIIADRNTTIYAVARDAGLNYATVHGLAGNRSRRVDLETVEKICAVLGITIGELFVHVKNEEQSAPTLR